MNWCIGNGATDIKFLNEAFITDAVLIGSTALYGGVCVMSQEAVRPPHPLRRYVPSTLDKHLLVVPTLWFAGG